MAFNSTLIRTLDPFSRYPAVDNWLDDSGSVKWSIRPFWIIADLRIMHNWLNGPRVLCNRLVDRNKTPLIFHYMEYIKSPHQQSFVLERNGVVVGQYDLGLTRYEPAFVQQLTIANGFCINYLFPGEPNSAKYWQAGLAQLVKLLAPEIPEKNYYIDMPRNYFDLPALVEQTGFRFQRNYMQLNQEMSLYMFSAEAKPKL
jgi:hypothetical protein